MGAAGAGVARDVGGRRAGAARAGAPDPAARARRRARPCALGGRRARALQRARRRLPAAGAGARGRAAPEVVVPYSTLKQTIFYVKFIY